MAGLTAVRARWGFLLTIHPLFLSAESLPTIERASQGYYDTTSIEDIYHLENEITTLRTDFRLNFIKQQQVDIDQLTEEDPALEGLGVDLQTLLDKLEDLIDPGILNLDLEVSLISSDT